MAKVQKYDTLEEVIAATGIELSEKTRPFLESFVKKAGPSESAGAKKKELLNAAEVFGLTGLDADATYEVKLVEPAGAANAMQLLPPKWYAGVRMSGGLLASMGLRAPVLRPEQAILIEAKRVK